jgi:hypothetical protein
MRKFSNPVLVLVITLPLLAVAGSFVSLALAVTRGDRELPKDYHWEGASLEADQQHEARAAQLHIGAMLAFDAGTQRCIVTLRGAAPDALHLRLTHPTQDAADVQMTLPRESGRYSAPCKALPVAHWWLELADDQSHWLLRTRLRGNLSEPVTVGGA